MISAPLTTENLFHSQTWQNPYTRMPVASSDVKVTLSMPVHNSATATAGLNIIRNMTTGRSHPTGDFSISEGELEGCILQFLASLTDTPSWENTVSLVNEHHQTLAHLAVLFRYTTLLKKLLGAVSTSMCKNFALMTPTVVPAVP